MTSKNKKGKKIINVALPKGRLGEKVYDIFEASGFPCLTSHMWEDYSALPL